MDSRSEQSDRRNAGPNGGGELKRPLEQQTGSAEEKTPDIDQEIRALSKRWSGRGGQGGGFADAFGTAGMMGFHLLSGMLVGGFIGYWLDKWLDTGPWMKVVFFVVGIAAGFRNIYLDAQRLLREQESKDKAWKGSDKKNAPEPGKED